MKFSTICSAALFGAAATALPVLETRQSSGVTDADILQFALTLEHLENNFYNDFLAKTPQSTFTAAGYTPQLYSNLKYIAHDETGHVQFLESGLTAAGAKPVQECTYKFPYTDVKSFLALASVIEGVGVSAYLGAAPAIMSKSYLTDAGAVLVVEGLHTSLLRYESGEVASPTVFATPLGINAVYSIASQFITGCPSTNAALPVKAYPALTLVRTNPAAPNVTLTFSTMTPPTGPSYVTFVSGLSMVPVPAMVSGTTITASVPASMIGGQSYAFLTNSNSGNVTDATVIAGPAIVEVTPDAPTYSTIM